MTKRSKKFPLKCYFTPADLLSQNRMEERYVAGRMRRLERNLKAAALLQDQIVFRATAAIKSNLTAKLIAGAARLLQEGILVPEVRLGETPLAQQLPRELSKKRGAVAELIDNAKQKEAVEARSLADKRSFQLMYHLFRLKLFQGENFVKTPYLKSGVSWLQLESLFAKLTNEQGIVDRGEFIDDVKALFKRSAIGTHLVQSIYFNIGAAETGANPIWSREISPNQHLELWQYPQPELDALRGESLRLAQQYRIAAFLEERAEWFTEVADLVQPDEIIQRLNIPLTDLDELSWEEILELRGSKPAAQLREALGVIASSVQEANFAAAFNQKVNALFAEELKKRESRNAAMQTLDFAFNVLGMLPFLGNVFSLASMAKVIGERRYVQSNLPLLSFNEFAKQKLAATRR